jgi:hypothetical protein
MGNHMYTVNSNINKDFDSKTNNFSIGYTKFISIVRINIIFSIFLIEILQQIQPLNTNSLQWVSHE